MGDPPEFTAKVWLGLGDQGIEFGALSRHARVFRFETRMFDSLGVVHFIPDDGPILALRQRDRVYENVEGSEAEQWLGWIAPNVYGSGSWPATVAGDTTIDGHRCTIIDVDDHHLVGLRMRLYSARDLRGLVVRWETRGDLSMAYGLKHVVLDPKAGEFRLPPGGTRAEERQWLSQVGSDLEIAMAYNDDSYDGNQPVLVGRAIGIAIQSQWEQPPMEMHCTFRRTTGTDAERELKFRRAPKDTVLYSRDYHQGYTRFVTSAVPWTEGEYTLHVTVHGNLPRGRVLDREFTRRIRAIAPQVTLAGSYKRRDIDADHDGLADSVVIAPTVNVLVGGKYRLWVTLNGQAYFARHLVDFECQPGHAAPGVVFTSDELREAGLLGDSTDVEARIAGPPDVVLDERRMDALLRLHAEALEPLGIAWVASRGISMVDANHDGLFEALEYRFDVEVNSARELSCSATLSDERIARTILVAEFTGRLQVGRRTLTLRFSGSEIHRLSPGNCAIHGLGYEGDADSGRKFLGPLDIPIGTLDPSKFDPRGH